MRIEEAVKVFYSTSRCSMQNLDFGLYFIPAEGWDKFEFALKLSKMGLTGASICCTRALEQIQMDKSSLLQATSLNTMALNVLELQSRGCSQGLLHLYFGHWNMGQHQG